MQKFACITLDMEPDYGDPERRVRLLEDMDLRGRFADIVNRFGGRVTTFTVTSLFESLAGPLRELAECLPLEFSAHSHTHDPENGASRYEVESAREAFQKFAGRPPLGYRAPIGRIDRAGLSHLMDLGYGYDASVYTSVRPGKFGYFNLHMPNTPFWITRNGEERLLEFPFTSISTVRVPFALSYAKLLGWGVYSALLQTFGLPDVALLLMHPYDLYTRLAAKEGPLVEKFALTRNDQHAFEYFESLLEFLKGRGYQFLFLSEAYELLRREGGQPRRAWEGWR